MAGLPTVDGGKGISDRNEGGWIDCVWMRLLARQGTRALQLDRNCSQENTPRTVRDPRWDCHIYSSNRGSDGGWAS